MRLFLFPPDSKRGYLLRAAYSLIRNFNLSSVGEFIRDSLEARLPRSIANHIRACRVRQMRKKYKNTYNQFIQILSESQGKPIFLFPPSLDWHTQLFQRPQQLARALAKKGGVVFYFQPLPFDKDGEIVLIEPNLFLCDFPIKLISEICNTPEFYLYVLTWNYKYAKFFPETQLLYDYVDEIEVFDDNQRYIVKYHNLLLKNAEIILATSNQLFEQVRSFREDVILCPNGVDYNFFSETVKKEIALPPDLLPIIQLNKPIIGYYGALARWFNYDLWKEAALRKRGFSFVLIGPDYDGSLPPELLNLSNVFWLGVKPYHELPQYLKYFDVATIPFRVNKITDAVSPLKLFEYMAGGKPIVSTKLKEVMQYKEVLIASDTEEFIELLDKALELRNDPDYLKRVDELAEKNSWDSRASLILEFVSQRKHEKVSVEEVRHPNSIT